MPAPHLHERLPVELRGHLKITALPLEGGPLYVVYDGHNDFTDLAQEIFAQILCQQVEAFPARIVLGDGGQQPVGGGADTGVRVAPDPAETTLRSVLGRVEITHRSATGGTFTFTAVAGQYEANFEDMDEYGLETDDGRLLSHVVSVATSAGGPTTKRTKTSAVRLMFEWSITFVIAAQSTVAEG